MRAAPAEVAGERVTHLMIGWPPRVVEESPKSDDDARDAVAALRRVLVDEHLLHRIESVRRSDALHRSDLPSDERLNSCRARGHRGPIDDHRTGSALLEPAPELRPGQSEVVAEDGEQRRPAVDCHLLYASVD